MKNKTIALLALISFMVLSSCSSESTGEDDNGNPMTTDTTVDQDKENIQNSIDEFHSCIQNYGEGTLADFVYYSVIKTTSNNDSDNWTNVLLGDFDDKYGGFKDGFKFSDLKGKYVWDVTEQKWNKTQSDIVEFYFPSKREGNDNNTHLYVDNYVEKIVTYEGEEKTVPLKAHIIGKLDGDKLFEFNIDDVEFDINTNFSMPLKFKIDMFVSPHNFSINFKRNTPTEFDFNLLMTSPNSCEMELSSKIETKSSDYGNFTSLENDFKKIKGYYKINKNLTIKFNLNVEGIGATGKELNELNENEINSFLSSEVLFNDFKIADLSYDESIDKIPFNLIFKDGSKENVTKFTGDFEERIRRIFDRFIND